MSTKLTTQIIDDATAVVNTYVNTVTELFEKLKNQITDLTKDDFKGEAAIGFMEFFNNTITPMLTENLTGETSVTTSLKKLLADINETLIKNVDPQLGNANKTAGN